MGRKASSFEEYWLASKAWQSKGLPLGTGRALANAGFLKVEDLNSAQPSELAAISEGRPQEPCRIVQRDGSIAMRAEMKDQRTLPTLLATEAGPLLPFGGELCAASTSPATARSSAPRRASSGSGAHLEARRSAEVSRLLYAGRASTGMTEKELKLLAGVLKLLAVAKMSLAEPSPRDSRYGLAAEAVKGALGHDRAYRA
jgi:hypothetical protein